MATIRRNVISIPIRNASDTWECIVKIIAPTNVGSRNELMAVTGLAASLITREAMKISPIIIAGDGPRVRIYCIYGDDAIEGTKASESALSDSPVELEEWNVSLPCPADDLSWVAASLSQISSRITVRDMAGTDLPVSEEKAVVKQASINMEALRRL